MHAKHACALRTWSAGGRLHRQRPPFCPGLSPAGITVFSDLSQTTNLVASGTTADTISSAGYLFTFTRDKLFTGGTTNPSGRYLRVFWPDGLEVQYVTTGPNPDKARITVRRVEGVVFDLTAFTAKLLANAGAGRASEIAPLLNGQEPLNNPLYFDVSGNYRNEFSYDTAPNSLGTTAALTNYDGYVISLTLDYTLMRLAVADASVPPLVLELLQLDLSTLQLSWSAAAAWCSLESAASLLAQTRSPITNTVTDNGGLFSVEWPITGTQRLFRLRK